MPEAYFELGTVWEGQGKRTEAIQCYRAALALRPDYALAHNNFANLLIEDGQLEEAVRHYQLALQAMPDLGKTQFNLGLTLAKLGLWRGSRVRRHDIAAGKHCHQNGQRRHAHQPGLHHNLAF